MRGVAKRSIIGLFEDEFVDLSGVKFGAKHVFVAAVDRDDECIGWQVAEEWRFGG